MTALPFSGPSKPTRITRSVHGELNGSPVHRYTLTNGQNWQVDVSEYGGTLLRVQVPDRAGTLGNVCLCLPDLSSYIANTAYAGKTIGPVANRMEGGAFEIEGQRIVIPPNEGEHVLHGGDDGLHQCLFSGEVIQGQEGDELQLKHSRPGGVGGYPGGLDLTIRIRWGGDGTLSWVMEAEVDQMTPVNLTHHPYWNLSGDFQEEVTEHELQVVSSSYAEVTEEGISTGQSIPSRLSPMDFRFRRTVGHALPLLEQGGYDHCLLLDRTGEGLFQAAHLLHGGSGRNMTLWTNQRALQFYTGQGLSGDMITEDGTELRPRAALCLEPHEAPGALHYPALGSMMVSPGEKYEHRILYCFFVSPA